MIDLDLYRILLIAAWIIVFFVATMPFRRWLRTQSQSSALSLLLLVPGVSLFAFYLVKSRP